MNLPLSQDHSLIPVEFSEGFSFPQLLPPKYISDSSDVGDDGKLLDNLQKDGHLEKMNTLFYPSINNGARPTAIEPALADFDGCLEFELYAHSLALEKNNSSWVCSSALKKLFIKINSIVTLQFSWNHLLVDSFYPLFIRATPVYVSPDFSKIPVKTCPTHSVPTHGSNRDINPAHIEHVLRCESGNPIYEKDDLSGRLSVKVCVKVTDPAAFDVNSQERRKCRDFQVDYKFVCRTSCTSGMDRRPIHVIFTLENENGDVFGRRIWGFKICSCPKRDMQREELDSEVCGPHSAISDSSSKKLMIKKQAEQVDANESIEATVDRCFIKVLESLPEENLLELKALLAGRFHEKENDPNPSVQAKWRKLIQ